MTKIYTRGDFIKHEHCYCSWKDCYEECDYITPPKYYQILEEKGKTIYEESTNFCHKHIDKIIDIMNDNDKYYDEHNNSDSN